jgi:hypothetical protein
MATREAVIKVVLEELAQEDDAVLAAAVLGLSSNSRVAIAAWDERKMNLRPWVRITDYVESVVPLYNDIDFKRHFRMYRETFQVSLGVSCLGFNKYKIK